MCLEVCDIQVDWIYRGQRKENKLFLVISEVLHTSYCVGRVFDYQNDLWSGLEELLGGHHFWRGWVGSPLLCSYRGVMEIFTSGPDLFKLDKESVL